jgi:type I restriction enzyme S subunit
MGELKSGWTRVKFGELAECVNDRVDDPSKAGVERYVGLDHLDPENLTIRRWGAPDEVESTKLRFKPGDIIFGKRRAYQRKLAVADFEGICSAHAMVLRAKPNAVLPEFLPFFMQSDLFMERAVAISVGSLSPTINWKTLAAQEFALPPLEEQRRIAAHLLAVADIDSGTRSLVDAAARLRKAFLVSVFRPERGTRDCYPTTWRVGTVDDAGEVQLGQKRDPSVHHGVNMRPYLRVANVFDDEIDLSDVLSMHFADRDLPKYLLRDGDILLNEGQSADLLGRSSIWRGQVEPMCFQMTLLRFRSRSGVLPEFAHAFFQHMLYTKQFAKDALQTTSIAHLSASKFGRMTFPVPPIEDQRAILRDYDLLRSSCLAAKVRSEEIRRLRATAFAEMGSR